jgi:hypothetical protein
MFGHNIRPFGPTVGATVRLHPHPIEQLLCRGVNKQIFQYVTKHIAPALTSRLSYTIVNLLNIVG